MLCPRRAGAVSRVPTALKIFLMALAIIDDLGAIVIIALFYTHDLSMLSLGVAAAAIAVLVALNLSGVRRTGIYSGWRGAVDGGAEVWRSRDPCRGDCRLYDPARRKAWQVAGQSA